MAQIIYVLINQAMPDLVKIGRTEQDIESRIRQLDTTGVPLPFECFAAYEVADANVAEKALHLAFGDHRIRSRREFFKISPDKPTAILKAFGIKNVTPGEDIVEDKADIKALELARSIKPRFKFSMVKIEEGAVLHSVFDDEVTCTVTENEKVLFRDEEHSLSSSALIVAHDNNKNWKAVQGPQYWKYNDEILVNLRDSIEG